MTGNILDLPLHLISAPSASSASSASSAPSVKPDAAEQPADFISDYLIYTKHTEPPLFYHRWTAVSCLAAYLGRSIYCYHGHFIIHPNLYVMFIGSPGTKKSSAIKMGAKLLSKAGYLTFAARKTRQEKFLLDLAEQADQHLNGSDESDMLDGMLFGGLDGEGTTGTSHKDSLIKYANCPPCETFAAADEFNNFVSVGNTEFISILGELWDFEGVYDYRLKNSKSVYIPNPTVNILGGNTASSFAKAFPVDTLEQGFFSRLLLVYAEGSGIRITWPDKPDPILRQKLIDKLHTIGKEVQGEVTFTPEAKQLIDYIYNNWPGIDDLRFEHYANRRLTHLIKLTLVCAASRISTEITKEDVVYANTLLTFTESLMPKALGEFGKARNSDVTHKIMVALETTMLPMSLQDLWKVVQQDLESRNQLIEIINNLQIAEKIQATIGGYLPIKKVLDTSTNGKDPTLDWNLLTEIERGLL